MNKNAKIGITLKEFDFLRAYIDIASPTFANAYKSALQAGYTKSYARVIRRHYLPWRMKLLKMALKDDDLVEMIEATRGIDLGVPYISEEKLNRIIRKQRRERGAMNPKEIMRALDGLLGKSV